MSWALGVSAHCSKVRAPLAKLWWVVVRGLSRGRAGGRRARVQPRRARLRVVRERVGQQLLEGDLHPWPDLRDQCRVGLGRTRRRQRLRRDPALGRRRRDGSIDAGAGEHGRAAQGGQHEEERGTVHGGALRSQCTRRMKVQVCEGATAERFLVHTRTQGPCALPPAPCGIAGCAKSSSPPSCSRSLLARRTGASKRSAWTPRRRLLPPRRRSRRVPRRKYLRGRR